MTRIQVPAFCPLCRSRCGAVYEVENGALVAAQAAPDHPTGRAFCIKGKAAPEMVNPAGRLYHPMRRTRPKGEEPGWQRISWEEALSETAARLDEIRRTSGAEAVAFEVTTPSGTAISDGIDWIERFIRIFGSPNNCYSTEICNWHKDHAHSFTYGSGILFPDYANAETIVFWGFNPSATWPDQAAAAAEARSRGAKILVVDPRCAGFAAGADHWLRVRPGTDGILALALANLLIENDAIDRDFVLHWTNGPFLVRADSGRFLREGDLHGASGERYVCWDIAREEPAYFDRETGRHDGATGTLALRGDFEVPTRDGPVHCQPAFERYAQVCGRYSPERAAEMTTVPAERIHAAAGALGRAGPVAYYAWNGVAQSAEATQTDRALALLMALKGGYDAPGGNVQFAKHPRNTVSGFDLYPDGQLQKALGRDQRPLGPPSQGWVMPRDVYTAILEQIPYPIRALVGFGGNMAVSHAEPDRAEQALRALDFHVHCDVVETPTSRFADILLPVSTPWEREGLRLGFEVSQTAEELIQLRQPIVPRQGECRSDVEIVFDLAVRLGLGTHFFDGNIDAGYGYMLEPSGVSLAELRAHPEGVRRPLDMRYRKYAETDGDFVKGFATETGRVEIYSELLHRHGQAPIPTFAQPDLVDDGAAFPLVLTTAKSGYYCHSQQRGVARLRKREPEPVMQIHPDTAAAAGLQDGDWACLETSSGRVVMRVRTTSSLHHRVVVAPYGWWQANPDLGLPGYDPFSGDGANYNRLVGAEHIDPISGSVPHRELRCRVARATDPAQPDEPAYSTTTVQGVR